MVDTGATASGSEEDDDDEDDDEDDEDEEDGEEDEEQDDEDEDMQDLGEAAEASSQTSEEVQQRATGEGSKGRKRRRPVWTDEASANLVIALTGERARAVDGSRIGSSRLRRLRETADEREIDGAEYEKRSRRMFEKLHPRPSWAALSLRKTLTEGDENGVTRTLEGGEQGRDTLAELLSRDSGLVARMTGSKSRLASGRLEVDRLRNGNEGQGRATLAGIESLQFHPSTRAHVLMTLSRDRRMRLFRIDGKENALLQTLHVPDLPLQSGLFDPSGSSVLLTGSRPFMYTFDLQSGRTIRSSPWSGTNKHADVDTAERDLSRVAFQPHGGSLLAVGGRRGAIHLLEWGKQGASASGSLVGTLRMNAPLAGLSWNGADPTKVMSLSEQGTVHLWDTRNMQCQVQKRDVGLFNPKGLESSPDGQWCSIGSESGIVNMYKGDQMGSLTSKNIEAHKEVGNLTTATTTMRYNPDGQMLALASRNKKDAVKVVHLPSLSVFSNWPTSSTPLGHVYDIAFSSSSEYMALGNSRGKVLLYSLRHYL